MARSLKFCNMEWSLNCGAGSPVTGEIYLDLNDGTDFCLDEIEYPAPKPRIEWRDPAHADGRDVSTYKYENREITVRLQIYGANEDDLSDNVKNLIRNLLRKNPILEWYADRWADPLYFDIISPPLEFNTEDWFQTYIRDNNKLCVMSNVEILLEAKPFARGCEETVTLVNGYVASPDVVNCIQGIVLDDSNFLGDVPAPADIFIDLVDGDQWTDVIFGQRLHYSSDFDPIQEPTAGVQNLNVENLNGDWRDISTGGNLVTNPGFENLGVGAPDYFANWNEQPSGNPNTALDDGTPSSYPIGVGTHSVHMYCTAGGSLLDEEISSDLIAVGIANTYFVSAWFDTTIDWVSGGINVLFVDFYDAGPALLGSKQFSDTEGSVGWRKMLGYVYPGDFPVGTTQIRVRLKTSGYAVLGPIGTYWDYVSFTLEQVGLECAFPLDSHEGRYLPVGMTKFEDDNTNIDLEFQAFLKTTAGDEITTSIAPYTIVREGYESYFREWALQSNRVPTLTIPSHEVSDYADKSNINQITRVVTEEAFTGDLNYDYFGIVPVDRAYCEARGLVNNEHLILDGRSTQLALSSLDGTLDTAMIYNINKQRGNCSFVADPIGFNGAMIILKENEGDGSHFVTSVVDVTMKYSPLYVIVPEE